MTSIAIIGGGYAGSLLARELDAHLDVTLIEPRDAFIHNVAAMRAVVEPSLVDQIVLPYDKLLKRGRVVRDRAVGLGEGVIQLASGAEIRADLIVAATGSHYGAPFKPRSDDSADFRSAIAKAHAELVAAKSVAIIGAGPVGLELAGEIAHVHPDKAVTLYCAETRLMPAFPAKYGQRLERELAKAGVKLVKGQRVDDPASLGADMVFPAIGAQIENTLVKGRVRTDRWMRAPNRPKTFVLGDLAGCGDQPTIVALMRQAAWMAKLLKAHAAGQPVEKLKPYAPYPLQPILIPIGPNGGASIMPFFGGLVLGAGPTRAIKGKTLFIPRYRKEFGLT
jgi:apoptosis-inducing factor 2